MSVANGFGDVLDDLMAIVTTGVRDRLAGGVPMLEIEPSHLRPLVARAALDAGRVVGVRDLDALTRRVADQLWGLGPLQPLLALPGLTDILVNGPGEVWVDQGHGLTRAGCALFDEDQVRALAVRLASAAGRRLDEASPCVDARLPAGLRLHAVLPPVSPSGTLICLRVPRQQPFTLDDLVADGTLPAGWDVVLEGIVQARLGFLVSGGTGAGKTTLLSSMLSLVGGGERIVLVEDVGELQPSHEHVVRLEARHPNVEGRGAVGLDDLVRQALRMRPDRLVVGECRGAEVRDLLAALNTGHEGGCGTVHANAPADVPARLQALGALASMAPAAVSVQAAAALDVVIHIERTAGGRRVTEIAAVAGLDGGELTLLPALVDDPAGRQNTVPGWRGPGWDLLTARLERRPHRSLGPRDLSGAFPEPP